ncbi:hypothetical protein ABIA39_000279 [Nocardia sp. GAS34]|uniref:TRADD-N-associated membrane domain-containing protein n=1 Tax=unclassified Nocardia TaxID=2637762 RepID=UPI003D241197
MDGNAPRGEENSDQPTEPVWPYSVPQQPYAAYPPQQPQQVFVDGENAHVNITYPPSPDYGYPYEAEDLRARYYFRFLGQSLTQATVTFILSMLVATAGMAVVLVGAALAVVHANAHASTVVPLLTGVAGIAVTTCGGAMAVQANKARKHAAEQAATVRQDMKSDQSFDRATTLIGKVDNPVLRDRLLAITAVNELGLSPNPIDLSKHLPAEPKPVEPVENSQRGQLDPGS